MRSPDATVNVAASSPTSGIPTSRLAWMSNDDLVLEDVDIEAETYGLGPVLQPSVPGICAATYVTPSPRRQLQDVLNLSIPFYDNGFTPLFNEEDEEVMNYSYVHNCVREVD